MKSDATDGQIESVLSVIEQLGFKGHPMPGATRTAIGITGNQGRSILHTLKTCPASPKPFASASHTN
jgi:hypothetical protein